MKTVASDPSGRWETSGDLAYIDADGAAVIVGREDDMIVIGGLNVYPIEVESVLRDIRRSSTQSSSASRTSGSAARSWLGLKREGRPATHSKQTCSPTASRVLRGTSVRRRSGSSPLCHARRAERSTAAACLN